MSSPPHLTLFWKEIGLTTLTTSDYSQNSPCEEIKRTSFPMLPCQHTALRDLLLMWKWVQPQCSFILDFCFVNTGYVVGDMTWTSYLSLSPSSNYTGSLIWLQSGYYIVPKAWYLLFSYCWWGLEPAGKPESCSSPTLPLHRLLSGSTAAGAMLRSNPGWLPRAPRAPPLNIQPGWPVLRKHGRSQVLRCLS